MNIIGNGQLAQAFKCECEDNHDVIVFASGVSNSRCQDLKEFNREKNLLLKTLEENREKKIIYFSSCALSAPTYSKNMYYQHKFDMESLVQNNSKNYYIFRIPQLFATLKHHNTLINYLYEAIKNENVFEIFSGAYRYVIDIADVVMLVKEYLRYSEPNIIIDIANPYRYSVEEIVRIIEDVLGKKGIYNIIKKEDRYLLSLEPLLKFIEINNIQVSFSELYLKEKLSNRIKEDNQIYLSNMVNKKYGGKQ